AHVVAAKEPGERRGHVLDPLDHRLTALDLALGHPRADLAQEVAEAIAVVGDDEALHAQALGDDEAEIPRARLGPLVVVPRDRAACDHAPERSQGSQRSLALP